MLGELHIPAAGRTGHLCSSFSFLLSSFLSFFPSLLLSFLLSFSPSFALSLFPSFLLSFSFLSSLPGFLVLWYFFFDVIAIIFPKKPLRISECSKPSHAHLVQSNRSLAERRSEHPLRSHPPFSAQQHLSLCPVPNKVAFYCVPPLAIPVSAAQGVVRSRAGDRTPTMSQPLCLPSNARPFPACKGRGARVEAGGEGGPALPVLRSFLNVQLALNFLWLYSQLFPVKNGPVLVY